MEQGAAAGVSRTMCATVQTLATGAEVDVKHTTFLTQPPLHENVARCNPGSDSYVPTRTGTV